MDLNPLQVSRIVHRDISPLSTSRLEGKLALCGQKQLAQAEESGKAESRHGPQGEFVRMTAFLPKST